MRIPNKLVFLAVLAAVAGCGSVHAAPAGPPAAAAATAATTSRVSMTETTGMAGQRVTITGSGAFDYARARGWLRLTGAGFGLEQRFLPPRLYVKVPGGVPDSHGKSWLSAAVAGTGASVNLPRLFPGPQAPPGGLLDLVASGSAGVRNLGITTTIGGTRVTRYSDSLDIARAIARARPAAAGRLRGLAALLGATRIPAQVWVDGRGLLRRIQVSVPVPSAKAGVPGYTMTETVTYSDFGVPVRVAVPPAADVVLRP